MSSDTITCPVCSEAIELDFCDGAGHLVTYWGDADHDYWCEHCDAEFKVREYVTRWHEPVPADKEQDDG